MVEGVVCGACGARVLGSGYREAFEGSFWGERGIVSERSEQATTFLEIALCCGFLHHIRLCSAAAFLNLLPRFNS